MSGLGWPLAALIGLLLGTLGGGGSILLVPALIYAMDVAPKDAIVMSLPVVGLTSAAAALSHWLAGNTDLRAALRFGSLAMVGAFAGARLGTWLPPAAQLAVLGVVMFAAAASMLKPGPAERPRDDMGAAAPRLAGPAALGIGALTGLVGIGGGFLFVPTLVVLGNVPMHAAIGTSLVVIAMNAAAGLVGYMGSTTVPWPFVATFAAVAGLGAVAGAWLARRLPAPLLRRAFGVLLLLVAAVVLVDVVFPFCSEGLE